jgi:hypothetical protein
VKESFGARRREEIQKRNLFFFLLPLAFALALVAGKQQTSFSAMGNSQCGPAIRLMEDSLTKELNEYIRDEEKRLQHHRKVLLLGAGEVGKSSLWRLHKIWFLKGVS